MFKRLGMFAILAVCLFAIVIAMGGCDGERVQQLLPPSGAEPGTELPVTEEPLTEEPGMEEPGTPPVTPKTDAPETELPGTGPQRESDKLPEDDVLDLDASGTSPPYDPYEEVMAPPEEEF